MTPPSVGVERASVTRRVSKDSDAGSTSDRTALATKPNYVAYRDIYSQPHAPDPILDNDLIVELVRRHTKTTATTFDIDETGGEARAYLFDEVVLKTQRPHQLRPRTSLEKEAFILQQLEDSTSVAVPRILGYGREGDVEYEVMSRITGIALRDAALSEAGRVEVLHQAGATLRAIHESDQSALEQSGLIPGDATSDDVARRLRSNFDDAVEALESAGSIGNVVNFDELRVEFLDDLSISQTPVTLHSNPGPEHCFVDPASEGLTGLIDFGDAYRSHPALDVRSWRSLDESRHLLEGYWPEGASCEFLRVWCAGVLVSQLRLADYTHADPSTLLHVIEVLRNT